MVQHAQADQEYQAVLQAIKADKHPKKLPTTHPARAYSNVWDHLSVLDGQLIVYEVDRVVIPSALRPSILKLLHTSHSGIVKTRKTAQQLYFWPNINNDIKNLITSCEACQRLQPSQAAEPLQLTEANRAFEQVGVDLFEKAGQHYLVLVDRFSGYPLVRRLPSLKTSTVTERLTSWFNIYGYPDVDAANFKFDDV